MDILSNIGGKAIGFLGGAGSTIKGIAEQKIGGLLGKVPGDKVGGGSAAAGASTGFNVQNMVSSINRSGIAQASHFDVQLSGAHGGGERDIVYRADSVNLPGRTITTAEHKFTNYGPINKVPYGQIYGDSTLTFLLSEDLREKDFFENWQNRMVNTGAYEGSSKDIRVQSKWNVKYFDGYTGNIIIRQYGAAGNLKTIHTLQEAYPVLIGDVAMAWGNGDPAKLSVTFAYKNYRYVTEDSANQPGMGNGFSFNLSKDGLAGALRIPGFANISGDSNLGTRIGGLDMGLFDTGPDIPDASASLAAAQAQRVGIKNEIKSLRKYENLKSRGYDHEFSKKASGMK